MLNSNHTVESVKFLLVHAVSRYNDIVEKSCLAPTHKNYQPLHFDKKFKIYERKLMKYLAKTNWYSNPIKTPSSWRSKLPPEWVGSKPIQRKVHGIEYTTVLQCPSSKDSRLVRALAKVEPRLARSTGYQVKITEQGGKPLAKMFSTNLTSGLCHRNDCGVCDNPNIKGPPLCQVKSVVYQSTCEACDIEHKKSPTSKHKGLYIGESYRTLYERILEHRSALSRWDDSSFMYKHWALTHPYLNTPPPPNSHLRLSRYRKTYP